MNADLLADREKLPAEKDIVKFRNKIVRWFNRNERKYPWRETSDPFRILIAEMMLQRTKADQVVDVYNKFFSEFSDPNDVARTNLKNIHKILYPLGLLWRVKNFKKVCRYLVKNYDGRIPKKREDLIKMPGTGDYVSGMVLSVAFNKPEWAVDSNIVRIFKRYFGISTTKEGRRDRYIIGIAKKYASCNNPKKANLGIVDFTALICSPRNPKCEKCSLQKKCYNYSKIQQTH